MRSFLLFKKQKKEKEKNCVFGGLFQYKAISFYIVFVIEITLLKFYNIQEESFQDGKSDMILEPSISKSEVNVAYDYMV